MCCFVEVGVNLIIIMGFVMIVLIEIVVLEYFDIKFVNIDGWVNLLNV